MPGAHIVQGVQTEDPLNKEKLEPNMQEVQTLSDVVVQPVSR